VGWALMDRISAEDSLSTITFCCQRLADGLSHFSPMTPVCDSSEYGFMMLGKFMYIIKNSVIAQFTVLVGLKSAGGNGRIKATLKPFFQ
jgi:hypothetical protein